MRFIRLALFVALAGIASPALAQVIPSYNYPSPGTPPMVQLQCSSTFTNCLPITAANPLPTADIDGTPVPVTPQSAVGVIFSANTTGYAGVSYVANTGWSGSTITFEGSNDSTDGTNGNWTQIAGQIVASSVATTQTQSAGAAFFIPATTLYVRARVTAFSTGPVGGVAYLRSWTGLTQSNTVNNNKSIWYTEANNVAVAVGANQNGTTRDTGAAASDYRYANWSCFANPTVSSTGALLVAQGSLDGTNWIQTQAVAAATAGQASTTQNGIFFRYNRCVFNNTAGSAATNIYLLGRYSE